MREYRIKRGHDADVGALITKFFGAKGDIYQGVNFEVEGIGKINIKQDKSSLFVDIEPPKTVSGDYSIIKKWNTFLYEVTGKDARERKKEFGKIK
jgi:hypothetical protein